MAAPDFKDRVIEPPLPNMSAEESYVWLYDLWDRTGGYETYIVNLNGLEASVAELNTLVGINTNFTVQQQLDSKVNVADIGTMAAQDRDAVDITGGTLQNVAITNSTISGDIEVNVGTSVTTAEPGASLYTNVSEVGNIGGGEDNLMGYTLVANVLGTNGDYVEIEGYGKFAANGNNKRVRLYFGGTLIFDTTAIAANSGSWWIKAKVMREASADQKAIASIIATSALLPPTSTFTDTSISTTSTIAIQFTGEATADNDIQQEGMAIKWFPAAI
jgi:hypothetical protein